MFNKFYIRQLILNHWAPARFKSLNSTEWLERRLQDKYVELAKTDNYRCRSAYKLLEINSRYNILKVGQCVVELGAAPGSWTQVLVKHTNADGKDNKRCRGTVIAIDRLPMAPISGALILPRADFTKLETQSKIKSILGKVPVDLVASDMAPNATGIKELDKENIFQLAVTAARFTIALASPNSSFLVKVWDDSEKRQQLETQLKKFYEQINTIRPKATQSESSELFILARGFKN